MSKKDEKKKKNIERPILLFLILTVLIIGIVCVFLAPETEKEMWVQKGNKITRGNESYEIGDYYEYDETGNGEIKDLTDVKWKVLGVDKEGNLLIVSASNVEEISLGKKDDIEITKKDFQEASSRINEIAEKYGHNVVAKSARSINAEDIHKITEFDKIDMYRYNEKTTYYWGNNENPFSKTEDNDVELIKVNHNNQFIWFNKEKNEWVTSLRDLSKDYKSLEEIVTLKNELIMYNNIYYDEEYKKQKLLEEESKEYKMLFLDDNGEKAGSGMVEALYGRI